MSNCLAALPKLVGSGWLGCRNYMGTLVSVLEHAFSLTTAAKNWWCSIVCLVERSKLCFIKAICVGFRVS